MFGRFDNSKKMTHMAQEWQEEFIRILTEAYAERADAEEKLFDVHGIIYDQEFVVTVSYQDQRDDSISPISLFISHDLIHDEKKMKKTLRNLMDLVGEVFDDIFATDGWDNYNSIWTENTYQDNTFFYKITRENVNLSLQAEELLKREEKLN